MQGIVQISFHKFEATLKEQKPYAVRVHLWKADGTQGVNEANRMAERVDINVEAERIIENSKKSG